MAENKRRGAPDGATGNVKKPSTETGFALLKLVADEASEAANPLAGQIAMDAGTRWVNERAISKAKNGEPPSRVAAFFLGVIAGAAETLALLGGRDMAVEILERLARKHREDAADG